MPPHQARRASSWSRTFLPLGGIGALAVALLCVTPTVGATGASSFVWKNPRELTHPSAREGAASAYDAKDGYLVLFGGKNASSYLNDTWILANGHWKMLSPS